MTITFFVPGVPKPQPRLRPSKRFVKGGGTVPSVYMPPTADNWRNDVRAEAMRTRPPFPIEGGVAVTLAFRFSRPKSHLTSKGLLTRSAPLFPTGRNDCDNLAKAVIDALDGLGFWHDDGQIVDMRVTKCWDSEPGVRVDIMACRREAV